jgi:mRNA-degrading endonuclease RelE of RelBE toxin-antitoxin system
MKRRLGPYNVRVKKKVEKFISKLDKKVQRRSVRAIENLVSFPIPENKKHILATKGNALLCELSVDKIRFYYEVKQGIIFIEDFKYVGVVEVLEGKRNHKSGNNQNYPNQQKFINSLLKWFKSKFG